MNEKISNQRVMLTEPQLAFITRLLAAQNGHGNVQQLARQLIDRGIAALALEQKA
jgi:hypothetical protein